MHLNFMKLTKKNKTVYIELPSGKAVYIDADSDEFTIEYWCPLVGTLVAVVDDSKQIVVHTNINQPKL